MSRPTERQTLLLVQFNDNVTTSRTFLDFQDVGSALDGLCLMYERELKTLNPG